MFTRPHAHTPTRSPRCRCQSCTLHTVLERRNLIGARLRGTFFLRKRCLLFFFLGLCFMEPRLSGSFGGRCVLLNVENSPAGGGGGASVGDSGTMKSDGGIGGSRSNFPASNWSRLVSPLSTPPPVLGSNMAAAFACRPREFKRNRVRVHRPAFCRQSGDDCACC